MPFFNFAIFYSNFDSTVTVDRNVFACGRENGTCKRQNGDVVTNGTDLIPISHCRAQFQVCVNASLQRFPSHLRRGLEECSASPEDLSLHAQGGVIILSAFCHVSLNVLYVVLMIVKPVI